MPTQLTKKLLLLTISISISTTHLYPSNKEKIQQLENKLQKINNEKDTKYKEKQFVNNEIGKLRRELEELENEPYQGIQNYYEKHLEKDIYINALYEKEKQKLKKNPYFDITTKENANIIEETVRKGVNEKSYKNNIKNQERLKERTKLCNEALEFIRKHKEKIKKLKVQVPKEYKRKNALYTQLNKEFDNAGYISQQVQVEQEIDLLRQDSSTSLTKQEKNEKKSIKGGEGNKPPGKNTNYDKNELNPTTLLFVGLGVISFVYLVYKLKKHKRRGKETSYQPV